MWSDWSFNTYRNMLSKEPSLKCFQKNYSNKHKSRFQKCKDFLVLKLLTEPLISVLGVPLLFRWEIPNADKPFLNMAIWLTATPETAVLLVVPG